MNVELNEHEYFIVMNALLAYSNRHWQAFHTALQKGVKGPELREVDLEELQREVKDIDKLRARLMGERNAKPNQD
jgi:hypothetical protein